MDNAKDDFKDMRNAQPWLDLLSEAERTEHFYHEKCDNIDKLYSDLEMLSNNLSDREMKVFWANMEVLKPTLYSRPPVPMVSSRFKDRKELPRVASEMLERALLADFDLDDVHDKMKLIRDDLAINARGVAWCRLGTTGDGDEQVERVFVEHLDRKDFRHGPARKWGEVPWVARKGNLTREKVKARFGDAAKGLSFEKAGLGGKSDEESTGEKTAAVWELWHREKKVVVWVAEGSDEVLDIQKPFLDLQGFFPCPRPAYGTLQRRTLIPVPDFIYYRDQIEEINDLTKRMGALSKSLKVRGFYSAGNGDVASAVEAAMNSVSDSQTLVPVNNAAAFGGADSITWLPVEMVASVITQLVALRRQIIQDVYEITGLSDIMRGSTQASETLGAQELKAEFGSVRVRDRQEELVRLSRDIARMKAEIMAENFQPQTLVDLSQMDDLPTREEIEQKLVQLAEMVANAESDPQAIQMAQENPKEAAKLQEQAQAKAQDIKERVTLEDVMELYRSQKTRPFVLDIETDSTIQPNEAKDKQARVEYVGAIGNFIGTAGPIVQQFPAAGPLVGEVLKYLSSGFRAGREMEGIIEDFAEKVGDIVEDDGPTPEQEMQMQVQQQQMQAQAQEMQMKIQALAVDTQVKQIEAETGVKLTEAQVDHVRAQTEAIIAKMQEDQYNANKGEADEAFELAKQELEIDGG